MASFNHRVEIPLLGDATVKDAPFENNEQLPLFAREIPAAKIDSPNNSMVEDNRSSSSGSMYRVVMQNPFADCQSTSSGKQSRDTTYNRSSQGSSYHYHRNFNRRRSRSRSKSPERNYKRARHVEYSGRRSNDRSRGNNHDDRKADYTRDDDFDHDNNSLKWSQRTYSGRNQPHRNSPHFGRPQASQSTGSQRGSFPYTERNDASSFRPRCSSNFDDLTERGTVQQQKNHNESVGSAPPNFQEKREDRSIMYDSFQQDPNVVLIPQQNMKGPKLLNLIEVASKIVIDESALANIKSGVKSCMSSGATNPVPALSPYPQAAVSPHAIPSTTNRTANTWKDGSLHGQYHGNSTLAIPTPQFTHPMQPMSSPPPMHGITTQQPHGNVRGNWSHPIPVRASNMHGGHHKPARQCAPQDGQFVNRFPSPKHSPNNSQYYDRSKKPFPSNDNFWRSTNQMFGGSNSQGIFNAKKEGSAIPGLDMQSSAPARNSSAKMPLLPTPVHVPSSPRNQGTDPVPVLSPVEKPYSAPQNNDGGDIRTCTLCGSFGSSIVLHYVNLHPDEEVPCKLDIKALRNAIREKSEISGDSEASNVNECNPVEDLSWLPDGEIFPDAVCCKYCDVESNMRYYMIEHLKTHAGQKIHKRPVNAKIRRVPSTDLFCRFCEFQTPDMTEFSEHVTAHTGEFAYGCCYCNYRCPTMAQAKSHVQIWHTNKKASISANNKKEVSGKLLEGHACTLCGYVQLDVNTTVAHIKSKHPKSTEARTVAINMSKLVYKLVPVDKILPVDAEKSSTQAEKPKCDNTSIAAQSVPTDAPLLSEHPSEPLIEKDTQEKKAQEIVHDKQKEKLVSKNESRSVAKKSDCSDLKSPKSFKEGGITEKPSSAVSVTETAWKGTPAKLNDTVAKLRAQLVKDGASIAAADTEMVVEKSSGRKASYLEKLQSWATREKMYICGMPYCVSVCTSEDGLTKHRDFMHKDLTIALCRECDLTLPSITELFTHLRGPAHADYKKKFVCSAESVCQFTSVSGKIFMEHINKKHMDKQWLTCFWCNKKVLSSQALTEHMESKCNIQKKLLAAYVKYGLDGLPDDLPDIEDEERNKEQDAKLRCDETRSLDSPSDMEQDTESDRSDNRRIYDSRSSPGVRLLSATEQRESEAGISGKRLAPFGEEYSGLVETVSPKRSKIVQKSKPFDLSTANAPKSSGNAGEDSSRNQAESATDKVKSTLIELASGSNKFNKCPQVSESNSPVPQSVNSKPPFYPKSILKPNSAFEPATRLSTSRPFSSAVLPLFKYAKTTTDSKVKVVPLEELNKVSNNSPAPVTAEKGIDDELPLHISSVISLAIPEPTLKPNDLKDGSSHAKEILNSTMSNEPKAKNASRMDTADIYGALAASCIMVTTNTFQPDSLSLDKNQASLLKDVTPLAERAAIRKTKKTHTTMLGEASLRHLYKCPGKHCTYTTDDESNFWQHMSDAKKEKDRVCVYCLEVFERPETLIHHVREIHGTSAYQCAHCFYRAKTQMMILLHIHLHHSDLQAKSFIVPTVGEDSKQEPLKAKDVLKFVKPFVCGQDLCSYATLEEDDFKNHMKNSHLTISQSKCFYCSKKLDIDVLPIHFKEHGILKYNCLLCEWGTDDDTATMVHMCENHPEQTGRLFIRGTCESKMLQMAVSINNTKESAPLPSDPPKESAIDTTQTASEDVHKEVLKEVADDPDAGNIVSRSNQEKYKCGYSNCQFSAEDVTRLESHMKMCYLINKGHSLQCPTCKILFQDHAEYSAHVSSHDVRRYSCGLCSFRAQLPHYVKHHIRSYHRISFEDMKCLPLSQSADLDSAEFVFVQKSPKNSPQKSAETTNNPSASAPRGNPSVIDSVDHVPQQSIFQTEKMCAWCGYSTKVRLNLIRHLEKHKSQPLQFPLPIPVRANSPDPVPTTSKSTATPAVQNAMETAEEPVKSPMNWSEEPDQECPQYVPSNEVYRCSIAGCHYLAVDRSLYECHINTLHGNCRVLPCPHCPEQLHSVAVLIRHLRLHGPNLYRCSECNFLGMSKQSIKIHASNTHGVFNTYTVIRDAEGELQVGRPARKLLRESELAPRNARHGCGGNAKALDVMWECGICDLKATSSMEIKKHLSEKHLLSVLYRCSACGHGEKTHREVQQHVKTAHPRTEVAIEDLVRWRRLRGDRNTGERIRKSPGKQRQDAQAESSPEKRFSCYLCNAYKSNYKADMRIHIFREMGYSKYSCGYCKMKFFCLKLANKHSCQGNRKQLPDIVVDADEDLEREVNARLSSLEVKVSTQHCEDSAGRSPLPAELVSCEITESASPDADDIPVSDNSSEVYLYKCPSCRYKTNAKSGVRKHLLRHLQYRPYRCGHCGARFPKPKQCLSHHDSQHDGLPVDIENDVDQRCLQFVALVLKTLGTTASKNNELPESPLVVGKTWQCSFDDCNVKTTSLKSLLDHFSCHVPRSAIRCGLCPFSGNSKSTVEVHCRRAHGGHVSVLEAKPRPGSDGGEDEVPLEDGSTSMSATSSTTYECPFCPYSDSFPNNVTRHALRHYDFRFYSCGHCNTECLEPCDVEEHCASEHPNLQVLVKTVKKPDSLKACNDQPCGSSEDQGHQFKCSKCAFETMDLSRIRAHCKESHDPLSIFIRVEPPGQDPEVPVCVLVKEEPDEREIRGISDAKPIDVPEAKYYCNYCDHAAGSHEDLESHWESQHHQLPFIVSVPQPSYQCPQCEFTSLDMEMIKRHVTIHLKRYMCQRCGKEVHTFVEGVQHSKLVHPNVAVELVPHPKGTEKAIQDLIDGVRVEPNFSKQSGENLKVFVAPRSGRKMARKQCRSSKFTPKLKRRASARKGLPRAVKKAPCVVPRPTDEEMNKYFCKVPKSMGFKFNGAFSLRQLSEKLNLFPRVRVEEKCSLFK